MQVLGLPHAHSFAILFKCDPSVLLDEGCCRAFSHFYRKGRTRLWAFVAVNGDVQIGWCRQASDGWRVEDMDGKRLAGPFKTRKLAEQAGVALLFTSCWIVKSRMVRIAIIERNLALAVANDYIGELNDGARRLLLVRTFEVLWQRRIGERAFLAQSVCLANDVTSLLAVGVCRLRLGCGINPNDVCS